MVVSKVAGPQGATGPGEAGVLTCLTGVTFAGVIIFTLTGQTGDLLFRALLDLLGRIIVPCKGYQILNLF